MESLWDCRYHPTCDWARLGPCLAPWAWISFLRTLMETMRAYAWEVK